MTLAILVVLVVVLRPDHPRVGTARPTDEATPLAAPRRAGDQQAGESNTGADGTLTPRSGRTLSADGVVIQDVSFTGQVTIEGDDVTLRNVRVESPDSYGILVTGKRAVIEDSSVRGTPAKTLAGIAVDAGGTFRASKVDVQGSEDGVRLGDDSVLEDSWIHDLRGTAASHYDGVTADGFTGWRISRNTIVNDHPQTAAVWIGDPRYSGTEGVLEDNLLAGGGWTLYAGPGTGAGLRVIGNRFSTRQGALSGAFGPVTNWVARGNEWKGNVWADGPRRGRAVSPGQP